jgi:hypothetical protein
MFSRPSRASASLIDLNILHLRRLCAGLDNRVGFGYNGMKVHHGAEGAFLQGEGK